MSVSISEQQELLLLKAVKNNGKLTMEMAKHLYSTKQSARSAIQKLETLDYIERHVPGVFLVKKVPSSLEAELEKLKQDSGSEDN